MKLRILTLSGLAFTSAHVQAQEPVLFYDFSGVTGTIVPNLGTGLPDGTINGTNFSLDLGGPATGFSGGAAGTSLRFTTGDNATFVDTALTAAALGFSTDNYSAASWVRIDTFGGDSMVFGQSNGGAGGQFLHDGVRDNNPHMGHWGADTTAGTNLQTSFGPGNWFHLAFRYRGDEQIIYVNGNVVARNLAGNLLNAGSNVVIGSSGNNGGMTGAVDDVVTYNSSLRANQIAYLAAGGNPTTLPAPGASNNGVLGAPNSLAPTVQPQGPITPGGSGKWAVREVRSGDATQPDNLTQAVNVLANPPAGSQVFDGFVDVINTRDPESGSSNLFANDSPWLSNTGADDNRVSFLYRAQLLVLAEGDYTFGYHGDDGFALRIGDMNWSSFTLGAGDAAQLDFDDTRTLTYPIGTGDANTKGTMHLFPGTYPIELVSWEGTGGGAHELYYAPGTFTDDAQTNTWRLVGDTSGDPNALRIVPEPGSAALLLGGFGALIGLQRSRRRRS